MSKNSANHYYRGGGASNLPNDALGESEAFLEFQERLSRAAKVDRPVLLVGERGTGKELAASRLHYLSKRWEGPLVALNCAALAPSLLESELFGHEAGSFTGAARRRQGRFESADGGTLFLDEIGLIPIEVQEKILRVVEYGSFQRVGSSESTRVNVRIIGATNADLPALARSGKFKSDLLDRLSFEVLFLPPLRYRREDIMLLAQHFAVRMAAELNWMEVPEFDIDAIDALERYSWPGNVRELKNVIERAVYIQDGPLIEEINFDPFKSPWSHLDSRYRIADEDNVVLSDSEKSGDPAADQETSVTDEPVAAPGPPPLFSYSIGDKPFSDAVQELELKAIRKALKDGKFHQGTAARILGISYHQFRGLYRKYKDELS